MSSTVGRFAWPLAFVAIAGMGFGYLHEPKPASSEVRVQPGPTLIRELRTLSRLETGVMHVEKIIELTDHQKRISGLVDVDDAILFIAVGEVVLGVDLSKVSDDDVGFDPQTGVARIELPPPEVLSTRFDEGHSRVHSRSTDLLARRNEGLEAEARRQALAAFAATSNEPRALAGAKTQAETQLRTLARAWGARDLLIMWKEPVSELTPPIARPPR